MDKYKLKTLVNDARWETILEIAEIVKNKWREQPIKENDEFNTMWNASFREGKIAGLVEFIKLIEDESHD